MRSGSAVECSGGLPFRCVSYEWDGLIVPGSRWISHSQPTIYCLPSDSASGLVGGDPITPPRGRSPFRPRGVMAFEPGARVRAKDGWTHTIPGVPAGTIGIVHQQLALIDCVGQGIAGECYEVAFEKWSGRDRSGHRHRTHRLTGSARPCGPEPQGNLVIEAASA